MATVLIACGSGETTTTELAGPDNPPDAGDEAPPPENPVEPDAAADLSEGDSAPSAEEADGEAADLSEGDSAPSAEEGEADAVAPDAKDGKGGTLAAPPEAGLDETADYGASLVDPRFPNTQDEGPENWPAWRPTHSIEMIEVPLNDSKTMSFERTGDKRVVRGEIYLEGDKFELRHKLFENDKRVAFERIQCKWKDSGSTVELGCKAPQNKTVKTVFNISRAEGSFTMTLGNSGGADVKYAPRKIVAKLL
ncbi:MAG: hypothetical protein GY898_17500 [Proteobacteria bacterium]|nr:hypothetical protein [Pseudomonadota bacterium]